MGRSGSRGIGLASVLAASALVVPLEAAAADVDMFDGQWQYQATIYGWLPSMYTTFRLPIAAGGGTTTVDIKPHDYLSDLKFAQMAAAEARRGEWSIFTDLFYADLSSLTAHVRQINLPPPVSTVLPFDTEASGHVRSTVWTLVGGYTVIKTPSASLDVIGGFRYADLKLSADWSATGPVGGITLSGGASTSVRPWDGIIGVKGAVGLADDNRLFMPYEADIGWGSKQRTWNGFIGLGYRFDWGDLLFAYRNLSYIPNGEPTLDKFRMGGLLLGATFRW